MKLYWISVIFVIHQCKSQINLTQHFDRCETASAAFDECLKDGINQLNPYFQSGLPDYNINSFDPFFAEEVHQKRRGPFYEYRLILSNVTESGWSQSQVTKLRTDFPNDLIEITQFFPDKRLNGIYDIDGTILGRRIKNSGSWNLALYDYSQTLTVMRKTKRDINGKENKSPSIAVKCNIKTCKKLQLHIGNLAGGRTIVENLLDWVINTAWQPGFVILSPLINDLVSTAFTDIFNKDFQNFPFSKVFK